MGEAEVQLRVLLSKLVCRTEINLSVVLFDEGRFKNKIDMIWLFRLGCSLSVYSPQVADQTILSEQEPTNIAARTS